MRLQKYFWMSSRLEAACSSRSLCRAWGWGTAEESLELSHSRSPVLPFRSLQPTGDDNVKWKALGAGGPQAGLPWQQPEAPTGWAPQVCLKAAPAPTVFRRASHVEGFFVGSVGGVCLFLGFAVPRSM